MRSPQKLGLEYRSGKAEASLIPFLRNRPSYVYTRGKILFSEGQSLTGVYYIRSGSVKISISTYDGRTLNLRTATTNELLGINPNLQTVPCKTTAEVMEQSQIDFIPRGEFMLMLDREQVNNFVLRALCSEADDIVEATRMFLFSDTAAQRLACLLLKWSNETGRDGPLGTTVRNRLTHQEIGEIIFTSRETVTRLVGAFKKNNIIGVTNGSILIRERGSLETIAHY